MTSLIKYPRTPYISFSPSKSEGDRVLDNLDHFIGKEIIVTEKMDGENTSIYRSDFHARSLDSRNHPSRNWLKAFHANVKYLIPEGYRICGENVFARHSIEYDNLDSYFYGFSVWNDDKCLSWDSTLSWFKLLGITHVPVLYSGIFDEKILRELLSELDFQKQEGFVVRSSSEFHLDDFGKNIAKAVRKDHVQTETHWMNAQIIANKLKI